MDPILPLECTQVRVGRYLGTSRLLAIGILKHQPSRPFVCGGRCPACCVERQLAWPVILPHSRMLPSRVIVASFKCSPNLPPAEPALQGGDGLDPPSDRLRGRRRAHTLILTPHATGFPAAESASHRTPWCARFPCARS